jgi:hypothetical protein
MYATYKGKEYKAAKINGELYRLIDYGTEPGPGFVPSEFAPQAYVKTVPRHDLGGIYIVRTYAEVHGERLEVAAEHDDTVTLATSDAKAAQRLGMDKIDRYDYRLQAGKSEISRFVEEIDQTLPHPGHE